MMAFHANTGDHRPRQGDNTVFSFFFLNFLMSFFFWPVVFGHQALLRSITLHHHTDTDTDDCEHAVLLYVVQ